VRTANKEILSIPSNKAHLATAIALEWDQLTSAQQALKQQYIPLTSLVSRANDIAAADAANDTSIRESILHMLMRYLATDTLLCWAPAKQPHYAPAEEGRITLRAEQEAAAKTILGYLTTYVWPGAEIVPVLGDSILPAEQPKLTQELIRGWLSGLDVFEMAGMERAVLATKSLLVGVRLVVEWSQEFRHVKELGKKQGVYPEGRFGIAEASDASSLEVTWQTRQWGEVEDTHDVNKEDLARQLGSVILLVSGVQN
jgi:chaperone required for assembly of F1-ATPase